MDSASGSMQSSSGGEDQDDVSSFRADQNSSFPSSFINNFNPIPMSSSSNFHPTFFDSIPSSNFLTYPFSQSHSHPTPNPSLPNLDTIRSRTSRSDLTLPGSSSHSVLPIPQTNRTVGPVKNPKKRTRASRRAPTTVLTTDTSNFRAMVQEFTGTPSAPFSAASAYSRRLDIFSSAGAGMRSGQLDPFGSLLRPLAQRVQIPSSGTGQPYPTSSDHPSINITGFGQNNNNPGGLSFLQPPPPPPLLTNNTLLLHGHEADFGLKSQSGSVSSMDGLGLNPSQSNINFGGQENQYKVSYSSAAASSSDFHHLPVLENVSSRAQGTVDSWIFPSDHR